MGSGREQALVATRTGGKGHTIELDLVPLDDGALDLEEGQADRRLPVLGALEDQVVELVTDLGLSQSK